MLCLWKDMWHVTFSTEAQMNVNSSIILHYIHILYINMWPLHVDIHYVSTYGVHQCVHTYVHKITKWSIYLKITWTRHHTVMIPCLFIIGKQEITYYGQQCSYTTDHVDKCSDFLEIRSFHTIHLHGHNIDTHVNGRVHQCANIYTMCIYCKNSLTC